jgi:hypothetical protein
MVAIIGLVVMTALAWVPAWEMGAGPSEGNGSEVRQHRSDSPAAGTDGSNRSGMPRKKAGRGPQRPR